LWFTNTFDALTNLVTNLGTNFQLFLDGLGSIFGLTGAGKTVAEAVQAISDWLTTVFKPVVDGLADVVKTVTDLINGFFKLFGGTGTVNLGTMLAAATSWMADWQKFVDGIWNAFTGGVAGAGKTVTDALKAVTDWLGTVFQKLLEEIAKLWGWTPGSGAAAIHAGIQDVVNTIAGILGIGQAAGVSAANANAGLAALMAGQAGGFFDEFEYPMATNLPAANWKKTSALADSYGSDGSGSAVFNASPVASVGWIEYVQISKPLSVPDMKCGVTLSKLPIWNTISVAGLNQSSWRIKVQCNPTDKACYGVEIGYDRAQFYSMNAAGTVTNLGSAKTIPPNALGKQYTLEIKGNVLTLYRAGIVAATYSGVTPLAGRCVGFGAEKTVYIGEHPCINLAGVSWQPA
jgi:predicted RNase H-like HicB family nuclease